MRGIMIGVGAELISRYHWILYIFGGFLILTAVKMLIMNTGHTDPSQNMVLRLVRRWFRVTEGSLLRRRHPGRQQHRRLRRLQPHRRGRPRVLRDRCGR